jgi:hypothetical protein
MSIQFVRNYFAHLDTNITILDAIFYAQVNVLYNNVVSLHIDTQTRSKTFIILNMVLTKKMFYKIGEILHEYMRVHNLSGWFDEIDDETDNHLRLYCICVIDYKKHKNEINKLLRNFISVNFNNF